MSSIYDFFLFIQAVVVVFLILYSFVGLFLWQAALMTLLGAPLLYVLEMYLIQSFEKHND